MVGIDLAESKGMTQTATDGSVLQGTRILMVEDMPDIRDVFSLLLAAEGASVVATGSGQEAIDAASHDHFDVLLTDLGLPDIPGDIVIRQVLERMPSRPRVIVLTGFGEPHVSIARRAGADAVLLKPVPWATLMTNLQEVPSQHDSAA